MANPFDCRKQVTDEEAKEVVKTLKSEGKDFRIRKEYYMVFGEDYEEWYEYLVVIEIMGKSFGVLPALPEFTYRCHYTFSEADAEAFRDELKSLT